MTMGISDKELIERLAFIIESQKARLEQFNKLLPQEKPYDFVARIDAEQVQCMRDAGIPFIS